MAKYAEEKIFLSITEGQLQQLIIDCITVAFKYHKPDVLEVRKAVKEELEAYFKEKPILKKKRING